MAETSVEETMLKVPPQAPEVEQAVLGAMLLDGEAVAKAVESIEANYFYKKSHRLIFEAMAEMFEKEKEIDLYTLTETLKQKNQLDEAGGPYYLAEISNSIPTSAHIEQHLDVVKQKALSRSLIRDCETIISRAYAQNEEIDDLLDYAEQKIFDISERRLKKGFAAIKPILHQTFERIDELYKSSRSGVTGVPTGYKRLNELTAGFQPADLLILAGRPSMGKTAFALNIARNAAVDYGMAVGIFSLEMSSEALVLRLLCTEAKVNQMAVRTGKLTKDEMGRLTSHVAKLMSAPIFIDDSPSLNVLELRAKARRLKAEHNIQLLVIDYLQLMEATKGENRQQEITHISRSIKGIAKELDIPVLALSQLSRAVESRDKSKRPQLSDLRESGAIEQDADVVMFVYRPEYYNIPEFEDGLSTHNMCEIIIGKQRNGPTGNVRLTFLKEFG
ncbi:MAG TPA: replicative DNA helicase, partial [Caldithrix abyssi]|nr:replicative DNA helicase [Caldithrix abyssi]